MATENHSHDESKKKKSSLPDEVLTHKGLQSLLSELLTYSRKDTEMVFLKGDLFIRAQGIAKDYFAAWLTYTTSYSTRMAYNYMEISKAFGANRKRYCEAGAGVVVLTELLTVSQGVRETVLKMLTDGERVTGATVRRLKLEDFGFKKAKPTPSHETPGASGLKKMAEERTKAAIARFLISVANIEEGMDTLAGKLRLGQAVTKRDVASLIIGPAKIARSILAYVALPLVEENRSVLAGEFPRGSLWNRISMALDTLSSETEVAKVDDLLRWLRDEIQPLLRSVIDPRESDSNASAEIDDVPPLSPKLSMEDVSDASVEIELVDDVSTQEDDVIDEDIDREAEES